MNEGVRELMPHDGEVLVARNVLQVEDDRSLTRERDPAVGDREEARVRAAHTEDLLQSERERVARREGVHGRPARERAPKVPLERRDIAIHRFGDRLADGGCDRFLDVDIGGIGPHAGELDARSRGHIRKVERTRRRKHALYQCRGLLTAAARCGLSDAGERGHRQRTGERQTCCPAAPRSQPIGDEWTAHEVALCELAAEGQREVACGAILDAYGNRREAIVPRELDQRAHIRQGARVLRRAPHESARDLDLIELGGERPARRVFRADAVE